MKPYILSTMIILLITMLVVSMGCVDEKATSCVDTVERCPVFGNSLLMSGGSGIVGYSDCGNATLNRTSYAYGNYCNGDLK